MISHPDKILFPEDGITKAELAAYYEMIAPLMLPHLSGRPITMDPRAVPANPALLCVSVYPP